MLRCEYCARILKINRSDTYLLCSQKCKSKFKNKNQIKKVDEYVLGSINNEWYFVKDIVFQIFGIFWIAWNISDYMEYVCMCLKILTFLLVLSESHGVVFGGCVAKRFCLDPKCDNFDKQTQIRTK